MDEKMKAQVAQHLQATCVVNEKRTLAMLQDPTMKTGLGELYDEVLCLRIETAEKLEREYIAMYNETAEESLECLGGLQLDFSYMLPTK